MPDIDENAFRFFSYGLYLVTAAAGGRRGGQIANAVMQVSAAPPMVAVCLNKNNLTHALVAESGRFGVSVLEQETPLPFIGLFGFKSGRDVDKLSQVNFKMVHGACPVVTDYALAVLTVAVRTTQDVGTHTLFVGEVETAEVLRAGEPLTYAYYRTVKRGTTPSAAPTARAASGAGLSGEKVGKMKKYVCQVCGYVYDPEVGDPQNGVAAGTPFENLPADWVCPVCGAGKDRFDPVT